MNRWTGRALLAMCVTGTLAITSGCGGASRTNGVATGMVTCAALSGAVNFSPPLTLSGTAYETLTISLSAHGCTTSGSSVSHVTGASATVVNSAGTSGCTSLLNSKAFEVHVRWSPATISPSVVRFSGYAPSTSGAGSGLVFPGSGGKATVTGSFAGSNRGASSTATASIDQNEVQLLGACQSPAGISSLAITSGHFTLG
jgi:hypothetical protein